MPLGMPSHGRHIILMMISCGLNCPLTTAPMTVRQHPSRRRGPRLRPRRMCRPPHGPQPPRVPADRRRGGTATQTAVRYKYSVEGLIRLVDRLDTHRELALGNVMELLGVRTPSGLKDYRRFLQSGQAIILGDNTWTAAPSLSILAIALRNVDIPGVRATLREFPSYAALAQAIEQQAIGVPIEPEVFGRAAATLTAWAELTGLGAHVHGTGFFATPTVPNDAAFAEVATTAFEGVRGDGRWVATGRWLEQLIVRDGIHPNITRLRIQTASAAGLIKTTTEGSTTETQYDSHAVKVLDVRDGVPVVGTEYLYRGDFLIPGKASSSVRIERIEP